MPTATIRTSTSTERLQPNHPAPPATSNPIVRRLPMVPPPAGSTESEKPSAHPAPPATAVPHTRSLSSSRAAPSYAPLRSAHTRSNSNSSLHSSSLTPSTQPAASPLPSSLPSSMGNLLSPEPNGAQTIVYQSRPMSAVRSPMGGVMGPRSRSSTPNQVRSSSGLARRPPVLNL
ncbi:hypothetical protein NMY22_g19012 [Coprinellus aureogranulatus]|nr:hypothetical protein NMY22_g19012 [Coprinellus aureogranulatus]